MSVGPWRIVGEFFDPYPFYRPNMFYWQERVFESFSEAEYELSHLVAHGQDTTFRGGLKLINEDDVVICSFEPNEHNYGARTLLVETNIDLEDIKQFYNHEYRVENQIKFYYLLSAKDMTAEQKNVLNYLITVLMNSAMYMSGSDFIQTVFDGNKESLYTMVMNGQEITPPILSNALRGAATLAGRKFI